jgi:site-specific recombinase XerD
MVFSAWSYRPPWFTGLQDIIARYPPVRQKPTAHMQLSPTTVKHTFVLHLLPSGADEAGRIVDCG